MGYIPEMDAPSRLTRAERERLHYLWNKLVYSPSERAEHDALMSKLRGEGDATPPLEPGQPGA